MAAKRNLERKRQELIQQKQMEKMKRKSESGTAPEQPEKRLEPTTPTQLHRYMCTSHIILPPVQIFTCMSPKAGFDRAHFFAPGTWYHGMMGK